MNTPSFATRFARRSFTPENCVISVSSPKMDTSTDHSPSAEKITASQAKWEVEPLYNNSYRQAPLRDDVIKEVRECEE